MFLQRVISVIRYNYAGKTWSEDGANLFGGKKKPTLKRYEAAIDKCAAH